MFDLIYNNLFLNLWGIAIFLILLYLVCKCAVRNALKELVEESVSSALKQYDKKTFNK